MSADSVMLSTWSDSRMCTLGELCRQATASSSSEKSKEAASFFQG